MLKRIVMYSCLIFPKKSRLYWLLGRNKDTFHFKIKSPRFLNLVDIKGGYFRDVLRVGFGAKKKMNVVLYKPGKAL